MASNGRVWCGARVTADRLDDLTGVMEIPNTSGAGILIVF